MVSVQDDLSRRERQVLHVLYEAGSATAEQIRSQLLDKLSNSAVRTLLRSLERKGHVEHEKQRRSFVYRPVVKRGDARKKVLGEILGVFFKGPPEEAFEAFLDLKADELTQRDLDRMAAMIEKARQKESRQ